MRANETVLRNVLQGEKQFVVPLYQRPYSWKRPQLERLWSDVLELVDLSDTDTHFMGSLVLAQSQPMAASGIQSWLVVDGQQRLTTLSVLLCAIRDHLKEVDPNFARKVNVLYLTNEFFDGLEGNKLLPTQADRQAWIDLVNGSAHLDGENKIGYAYRYFRGQLELLVGEAAEQGNDYIDYFKKIERAVTTRLTFVEITAQEGDNAYRIFESLNNTGLKLTQADLLRNYLFMRLPTRSERVYRDRWFPIQNRLDEESLVELIWLELLLKGNRSVHKHSIYEEQRRFLESLKEEDEIEEWIKSLSTKASIFRRVIKPEEEPNPIVREALDRHARWGGLKSCTLSPFGSYSPMMQARCRPRRRPILFAS